MKKKTIVFVIIFLLCPTLIFGCGQRQKKVAKYADIENKEVSIFISYIEEGEYLDAINYYNQDINGNHLLESEVEEYLNKLHEDIVKGVYDNTLEVSAAKAKKGTIGKVLEGINHSIDCVSLDDKFDEALASKVAFSSGSTFFEAEDYKDAIIEYRKVSEWDIDYQVAQEKLSEAESAYKTLVITDAEKLANEKKFTEGNLIINEALTILPDDSDLLVKLNVYSKNYINDAIKQAETAFANNIDYSSALKFIRQAQQQFPDDADLKAKEDYYNLFIPISIFTLEPYVKGDGIPKRKQIKDNLGNTYEEGFYAPSSSDKLYEVYDIGSKYNILSGTIGILPNSSTDSKALIRIIGDEEILWEKNDINGSFKPQQISVDITGITDLRIEMKRGKYFYSENDAPLFADVTLQRTEK